jgi:predicted nuclease with TOPRIM domain
MRQQMEARLAALKSEFEKGQTQLRQLESQSSSLRETMMRISGAIMVLEELLSASAPVTSGDERQAAVVSGGADPSSSARDGQHAGANKED